jgi:hypothetical protein
MNLNFQKLNKMTNLKINIKELLHLIKSMINFLINKINLKIKMNQILTKELNGCKT